MRRASSEMQKRHQHVQANTYFDGVRECLGPTLKLCSHELYKLYIPTQCIIILYKLYIYIYIKYIILKAICSLCVPSTSAKKQHITNRHCEATSAGSTQACPSHASAQDQGEPQHN